MSPSDEKVTMGDSELLELKDILPSNEMTGADYLSFVSNSVSNNRGTTFKLNSPDGAILTMGSVEDTEYKNSPDEVNGWGKFYLPSIMEMKVFGCVEGTPYPCDQLVLMTCVDKKVYGYDGDELHLVASSLNEMVNEKSIAYPALHSYYLGEAFKGMAKKDWEEVKQGPVGRRLIEEQRKLVAFHKTSILENLKFCRQKKAASKARPLAPPDTTKTPMRNNARQAGLSPWKDFSVMPLHSPLYSCQNYPPRCSTPPTKSPKCTSKVPLCP